MGVLQGRSAIVTGASRGIGRAVAEELARSGARVAINYNASAEAAEALCEQLRADGCEVFALKADVSQAEDAEAFVEQAASQLGKVDILVNNAGINRDRTLRRMSNQEWEQVIDTDLNSIFYCTKAALPHMIEAGGGQVINMSSIIGQMGNLGQANYSAAKAGMIGFTKSAAQELARFNVTVNAVCPGFIETDMLAGVPEEPRAALLARIPLGRFGAPEDVARLVKYLCSDGVYITGQQININGGMYM